MTSEQIEIRGLKNKIARIEEYAVTELCNPFGTHSTGLVDQIN